MWQSKDIVWVIKEQNPLKLQLFLSWISFRLLQRSLWILKDILKCYCCCPFCLYSFYNLLHLHPSIVLLLFFDGFSFIVCSHKNCFMRLRREKGKSEEGRRKGAKEMRSNAPILSTSSLKLLLFNAPFFSLSVTSKWAKSPASVTMCLYKFVWVCITAPRNK